MATPSLLLIPDRYKSGVLYSQLPESGAGDLDFTRGSTATRVNALGLIESVASGVPRLDYTGGGCPSLLLEPQRTNLFLNSASGATQSITVTAVEHTLSFYNTGSVTLSGVASGTLEGTGTGVANRVSLTFTPTAGTLTLTVSGTITDVQLEVGSYPTSYIPTTSAAVTRAADVASKTGISSLIGQTEGTLFFDIARVYLDEARSITILWGGSGASYIQIFLTTEFSVIINGTLIMQGVTIAENTRYKLAVAYKSGSHAMYINGVQISVAASAIAPTVLNDYYLGNAFGAEQSGKYNAAALYPVRLSNTELASLTSL